jgi:hypothetical protein
MKHFNSLFRRTRTVCVVGCSTLATAALSCPLCASETGKQVRDGIGKHFTSDTVMTLAPLIGIVGMALFASWVIPDKNSKG